MEREEEKRDYSLPSMRVLIGELYDLKYKLLYELATATMAAELEEWEEGACMDVYAVTEELEAHIDVFTDMKAICEEMLRMVSDVEFDE